MLHQEPWFFLVAESTHRKHSRRQRITIPQGGNRGLPHIYGCINGPLRTTPLPPLSEQLVCFLTMHCESIPKGDARRRSMARQRQRFVQRPWRFVSAIFWHYEIGSSFFFVIVDVRDLQLSLAASCVVDLEDGSCIPASLVAPQPAQSHPDCAQTTACPNIIGVLFRNVWSFYRCLDKRGNSMTKPPTPFIFYAAFVPLFITAEHDVRGSSMTWWRHLHDGPEKIPQDNCHKFGAFVPIFPCRKISLP